MRRPAGPFTALGAALAATLLISGCTPTSQSPTTDPAESSTPSGTASSSSPPASAAASTSAAATPSPSDAETLPAVPEEGSPEALAWARVTTGQQWIVIQDRVTPGEEYAVHVVCDSPDELTYEVRADQDVIISGTATCPGNTTPVGFRAATGDVEDLPNGGGYQVSMTGSTTHSGNVLIELLRSPDPAR